MRSRSARRPGRRSRSSGISRPNAISLGLVAALERSDKVADGRSEKPRFRNAQARLHLSSRPQVERLDVAASGQLADARDNLIAVEEEFVPHHGVGGKDDQAAPFDAGGMGSRRRWRRQRFPSNGRGSAVRASRGRFGRFASTARRPPPVVAWSVSPSGAAHRTARGAIRRRVPRRSC